MPEVCVRPDRTTVCMSVDLTIFDDPRQGEVREPPGDPPGAVEVTGAGVVRTRVTPGSVPDAWPRDERVPGELVKGRERVPCDVVVRTTAADGTGAVELLLIGDEAFRAVLGRDP